MNITTKTWLSAIAGLILGPLIYFGVSLTLLMLASDALEGSSAPGAPTDTIKAWIGAGFITFLVILPLTALLGALTGAYLWRRSWSDLRRRTLSVTFAVLALCLALLLGVCAAMLLQLDRDEGGGFLHHPEAPLDAKALGALGMGLPTLCALGLCIWCVVDCWKQSQQPSQT